MKRCSLLSAADTKILVADKEIYEALLRHRFDVILVFESQIKNSDAS